MDAEEVITISMSEPSELPGWVWAEKAAARAGWPEWTAWQFGDQLIVIYKEERHVQVS